MHARSSLGALGLCVLLLSLSALSAQRQARERADAAARSAQETAAQRAALREARRPSKAVRALRRGQRVDLNRARVSELELLPGIGPTLAQRIVRDRGEEGPFVRVADLARVKGIGPRKLEKIASLATVGQDPAPPASDRTSRPRPGSR